MPVFNNILAGAAGSGGADADFKIERSLRFESSASAHLDRSFNSSANRKKYTISFWIKRGSLGVAQRIYTTNANSYLMFDSNDYLHGNTRGTSGNNNFWYTSRQFRDPSAWTHIVAVYDLGVSNPGLEIYVNGIKETLTGNIGNYDQHDGGTHTIGGNGYFLNGYLAEYHHLDGIAISGTTDTNGSVTGTAGAVYLTDFGEFDDNGVWQPKEYSGSHGTHGYYLNFKDNSSKSALGEDSSGNNNDWDVNNLAASAPGLSTADEGFDVLTYTGNNSSGRNITGLNFTPDLVWIKNRLNTAGYNHILVDSNRGAGKYLSTSSTGTESAFGYVSALNSGGFTVSNHTEVNASSNNYVAWCWKAGGTAVSNTDGSGLSNVKVSANNTYGFSIVTYDGGGSGTANTDSGDSFGHGLSSAPKLVICKRRTGGNNGWPVYHASTSLGALNMNSTGTLDTNSYLFAQKHPTDSVVYIGNNPEINATGSTYVAYCWSEIAGFSKFGTFTHSSTTSIDFGFKPRYWLVKEIDGSTPWYIFDAERDNFDDPLQAQSYGTEGSGFAFTVNDTGISWISGSFYAGTYIYAAFADKPDRSIIDSLIDTPTNADANSGNNIGNYATYNPLNLHNTSDTVSEGNLKLTSSGSGMSHMGRGTIAMKSGKWYFEVDWVDTDHNFVGIVGQNDTSYNNSYLYLSNAKKSNTNGNSEGSSYGATWGNGDTIGCAFDADNGTLAFYKNGVSQGTAFTGIKTDGSAGTHSPYPRGYVALTGNWNNHAATSHINFGQRPFAISSVPTGFKSLCTQNLTDPDIADGSDYFDVDVYAGTGQALERSNFSFEPDFLWFKRRSTDRQNTLIDRLRGETKRLFSDSNESEATASNVLTSFDTDGFTLGTQGDVNAQNETYVAWAWDAGSTTDTNNTAGSITPTGVLANPSAGFSIVSYTGTGSNATVGHGLNAAPEMVLYKSRGDGNDWMVYHVAMGATKSMLLNDHAGETARGDTFNNTAPTSSVLHIGSSATTNGTNTTGMIAYCFAPVEGFSSFGRVEGNGSANGPFIYTGFKPAFVMIKALYGYTAGSDIVANTSWIIHDNARSPFNANGAILAADRNNDEEDNNSDIDFLSNGFKIRNTRSINTTNDAIYVAFAEHPFKYSRAA